MERDEFLERTFIFMSRRDVLAQLAVVRFTTAALFLILWPLPCPYFWSLGIHSRRYEFDTNCGRKLSCVWTLNRVFNYAAWWEHLFYVGCFIEFNSVGHLRIKDRWSDLLLNNKGIVNLDGKWAGEKCWLDCLSLASATGYRSWAGEAWRALNWCGTAAPLD